MSFTSTTLLINYSSIWNKIFLKIKKNIFINFEKFPLAFQNSPLPHSLSSPSKTLIRKIIDFSCIILLWLYYIKLIFTCTLLRWFSSNLSIFGVFIFYHKTVFNCAKCFLWIDWNVIMWFLLFTVLKWCITLADFHMYSRNIPHLVIMISLYCVVEFSFLHFLRISILISLQILICNFPFLQ